MRKLVGTVVLGLVFGGLGLAQSPPPPSSPPSSSSWFGAGASWSPSSSPEGAGLLAYATQVSAKGEIWSFSEYLITSSKAKPWTPQTSTTTGIWNPLLTLGGGKVVFGTFYQAGVATSSSAGLALAGGGMVMARPWKSRPWTFGLAVQYLVGNAGSSSGSNKQAIYSFVLGRTWK